MEKREEEFEQRLSDAFENGKEGCIELKVRAININFGHNSELLKKCKTLYGYAYFVAEIRKNLETMELQQAVELAVEECIRQDILKEFLTEQRAEVIAMSIYEYNEEYVRQSLFEDGEKSGYNKGEKAGENKLGRLISILLSEGKQEEVRVVSEDESTRQEYYQKYRITD